MLYCGGGLEIKNATGNSYSKKGIGIPTGEFIK